MSENKFSKIFFTLAFVALMIASCWATVESLHLLLPDWPTPIFWIGSVIFFVLASVGTKLIVDSFDKHSFIENRGGRLIGGIIMLFMFWVSFSLPTNTHTFFYRSVIKEKIMEDLVETKGKLESLIDDGEAGTLIKREQEAFEKQIRSLISSFEAEVNNPGNAGWGDRAEAILIEIEKQLGLGQADRIVRVRMRCNTRQCRDEFIANVRGSVEQKLKARVGAKYENRMENIHKALDKNRMRTLNTKMDEEISAMIDGRELTDAKVKEISEQILAPAYTIIAQYSDVMLRDFKSYEELTKDGEKDKATYGGASKTKRLLSVIDVWKDFFAGQYVGRGFVFWIIIAVLLDIAGFICYGIAFKREH